MSNERKPQRLLNMILFRRCSFSISDTITPRQFGKLSDGKSNTDSPNIYAKYCL